MFNSQVPVSTASADEQVRKERVKAETNFRKSKRTDNIATAVLWLAAGLTLAILVYILGFIVYRGFRSDNIIESEYIDWAAPETPLDYYGTDSIVVINSRVRLRELTYGDLAEVMNGKQKNWGNINGQDLDISPYMLKGAKGEFGKKTTYQKDAEDLVNAVEHQPGAIGIIPASEAGAAEGRDVRIIPLWALSIAINPGVSEIENNIKLRYIDSGLLEQLLRGEITNWTEAGGINLPVQTVVPPLGSCEYNAYLDISGLSPETIPGNAIQADSIDDYIRTIESATGAFGLILNPRAEGSDTNLLRYQYRKTGLNLQWWFLFEEPKRAGRVGGVSSIIINTLYMVLLTALFSTPLGIGAAVYLTEYAKQGTLVKILRLGTETLAGIPSIIFGLFGFIVFVGALHLGIGLLSGTLTLTLMILPTIIRTSEEAIKAVPRSFRAGSLALGAGKWQTIYKVVLPAAAPGILTGVILGMGRAVGETAALLFTMGFDYRRVENLSTSARVLSTHLYQLVKEGISFDRAFATATILIVIVLFVNVISTRLVRRKY